MAARGVLGHGSCRGDDLGGGRRDPDPDPALDQGGRGRVEQPLELGDGVIGSPDHDRDGSRAPGGVVEGVRRPAEVGADGLRPVALPAADLGRGVDGPVGGRDEARELLDVMVVDAQQAEVGVVDEGDQERCRLVEPLDELPHPG